MIIVVSIMCLYYEVIIIGRPLSDVHIISNKINDVQLLPRRIHNYNREIFIHTINHIGNILNTTYTIPIINLSNSLITDKDPRLTSFLGNPSEKQKLQSLLRIIHLIPMIITS